MDKLMQGRITLRGKGTETHISQAGRLSTWGQPAHSLAGAPSSSYHRGAKSVPTLRRLPTVAWVRGCGHESIYDFEHIRFSWSTCRITCVSIERFCRTIELNDKHLVYGIWKLKLIERKSRTKESSIKLIREILPHYWTEQNVSHYLISSRSLLCFTNV